MTPTRQILLHLGALLREAARLHAPHFRFHAAGIRRALIAH